MKIKVKQSRILDLLPVLFAVIVMVACSEEKANNQNQVESIRATLESECYAPNEHQTRGQEPSWTWLNITVGVSTEQDVYEMFGEPESKSPWINFTTGEQQACRYGYTIYDEGILFWLQDDKVVGIEFINHGTYKYHLDDLPETVNEAVELYGHPDNVGWAPGTFTRALVWLNKGVLLVAIPGGINPVSNSFYFDPMTESEFDTSLWSFYLIEEQPPIIGDVVDTAPRDPFDWEQ